MVLIHSPRGKKHFKENVHGSKVCLWDWNIYHQAVQVNQVTQICMWCKGSPPHTKQKKTRSIGLNRISISNLKKHLYSIWYVTINVYVYNYIYKYVNQGHSGPSRSFPAFKSRRKQVPACVHCWRSLYSIASWWRTWRVLWEQMQCIENPKRNPWQKLDTHTHSVEYV